MRLKLHHQILIAMLVGAAVGLPLNILAGTGRIPESWPRTIATYGKGIGDIFLRLLSMIVAPLILTSLVTGVTSSGSVKGLGRLGGRTLVYYLTTSMLAIITGMLVFNVIQPGEGSNLEVLQAGAEAVAMDVVAQGQSLGQTLWNQVFNIIPSNPFASLADPDNRSILGVIFFAILFGVFINVVGGDVGELLTKVFTGAFQVMMKLTMFIIKFAPVGVLGFMLYASAGKGLDVFQALGWYMLTVAVALSIHAFVTLPLLLLLLGRHLRGNTSNQCPRHCSRPSALPAATGPSRSP